MDNATHTICHKGGTGYGFIIEQDTDGWFWRNDHADSVRTFPAQSEALADAIRWVKEREKQAAATREAEEDGQLRRFGGG